ncbi:MAG: histidine phosphatase family protein [Tessaracoccus sp.]
MITLILVRHAKSDWSNPMLSDHDRPLNARGTRNAPMMAKRLADTGVDVQRILSSTALRARSTAAAFSAELGVPVELDEDLYHAFPGHSSRKQPRQASRR